MTKKTLGYVEMEWTCPRCGSKNPGPQKSCSGCGAPQPDDVEFEQAAEEELIAEEEEIERAKTGPDVHCAYCGARNPAGAKTCTQCSADLTEAAARVSGRMVGAHRREAAPDVACPSCGAMNPATAHECSQCGASLARPEPKPEPPTPASRAAAPQRGGCGRVAIIAGVVLIALIALGIFLTRPSSDIAAIVEDVSWTRTIPIMGMVPVTYEDWQDEIPPEAVIGDCRREPHHVQDSPAPNSKEICGTPYTVDKGSGYGEVVQDCQYEVYEEWCEYSVEELQVVDQIVQSGNDLNPTWPAVTQLAAGQQAGEGEETYEIVFDTDGGTYTYTTSDPAEFAQFQDGSRWLLKVNKLGGVVSVEPR
jgi:ribosomal protein L40E